MGLCCVDVGRAVDEFGLETLFGVVVAVDGDKLANLAATVTFIAVMVYAMIRYTYFSGPIPFAPYAWPIPLFIAVLAGSLTFRIKSSN